MSKTVLVVEDDQPLCQALCDTLELGGFATVTAGSGEQAIARFRDSAVQLVVSDVQMGGMDGHQLLRELKRQRPELPVLLMTAYADVESAVRAMREGASDYLVKPFESQVLVSKVQSLMPPVAGEATIIAADPATREVLELAQRIAPSDATVMVTGESGVGKEVLFRYIHAHSRRCAGPAVAINCAAIPENMLEAILFGYEKGAFTGALKACPGKFEQAQGGSILLDEISEMDLGLQAKLLRVLQEKQVERLGATQLIELDVRVVATSNRELRQEVAAGRFREDLYYRLNVFPLHMPALRERPRDILPLAEFALRRAAAANAMPVPELAEDARARLREHEWRGNVRELDNVMQRALLLSAGSRITAGCLQLEQLGAAAGAGAEAEDSLSGDLRGREYRLICAAIEEGRGSRKLAAEKLGLSPRTLRYKIARLREAGYEIPAR